MTEANSALRFGGGGTHRVVRLLRDESDDYDRPKSLPLDEPLGLPNELPVLPLLYELGSLPPA